MTDAIDFCNSAPTPLGSAAVASQPPAPPLPENWEWAGTAELCGWLGIDVRALYHLRNKRLAPVGHRVGKEIRYRRADVEKWLRTRRTESA